MEQRLLGSLATSAQGLGCMGLATVYGRVDPAEARATLDAAIEAGVTMLDTADMYGNGGARRSSARRSRADATIW